MKKIPLILILFLLIAYPSCEGGGVCTQSVLSVVNAGFYGWDGEEEIDVFVNNFTLYGINRPDSLIYDSKNSVSRFSFTMDMNAVSSTLIMHADSLIDTLTINYSVVLLMVSYECGFTNTFEMSGISFTRHFIDSISVIKTLADLENEENLKIFL
ncbi:MAG: hypothetical protein KAT31_01885 [Bacteroidales bacterium]|nr:hypothetical protein [Bacteroidales bacterium]